MAESEEKTQEEIEKEKKRLAEKKKEEERDRENDFRKKFEDKNIVKTLIATICPRYYAKKPITAKDKSKLATLDKLKKEGKFWEAVAFADKEKLVRDLGVGEEYFLSYNSPTEGLEPLYFWMLDFLEKQGPVIKIADTFVSSPGSGHFSEMMGKATRMQEEGMKIMQTIGVLIKSVINIVYDLRQFELRINDYDAADNKDKEKRESGLLALKQTWLDNVDIKRGNSSIKAMTFSQQGAFVTLLNAFLMTQDENLKDINGNEIDLNDIVKRVLRQRIHEFNEWRKLSKYELKKRYSMEKFWLKSQVDSLKLYSRWAKPYLQTAEQLRMSSSMGSDASLIKAFNTNLMQLTIMQSAPLKVVENSFQATFPHGFEKLAEKGLIRPYFSCIFVDFKFRGIPQRVEQHYAFGGKADVLIRGYSLSAGELAELTKRLEESDVKDALKLVEGVTTDSLKEIENDIRHFLDDKEDRIESEVKSGKDEKKKDESDDSNPFTALIGKGTFWGKEDRKKIEGKKDKVDIEYMKSENYAEKVVRMFATTGAKGNAFTLYDIFKKSRGMGSVPFDQHYKGIPPNVDVKFGDLF